jgi:UDP-N-acetylmuramoyl-L-alanyl-D-glutamate--2,6-diaminopimelate ligase
MSQEGRRSIPAWLRHIYLHTSRIQYPRRKEGGKMGIRLSELLESVPGKRENFRDAEVRGVTCDSRQVLPGSLFVAVPGCKLDGAAFVDEAIRRGAGAIVAEKPMAGCPVPVVVVPDARAAVADLSARFYGDPTRKMNVIGITGTNGKTTTTYLLRSILEAAGEKVGLLGTIQYSVGPKLLPSENTTPGADTLQRYFAEMHAAGCKSAAMEVSSHALDQGRVRGVNFAAAIFSNLTRDHMDYHPTFEHYRDAKGRLFEMLSPKSVAALNADDEVSDVYADRTHAHVVTYGLHRKSEIMGKVELGTFNGTRLRLKLGTEEMVVHSRLIGTHNVYNILSAAACTWAMGYDLDHIKAGIENLTAVPGRLEPVDGGQEFPVLVDYAHTDDALRNVLTCLRPLVRGRLFVVFGCGGDRDRGKRPKMGRVASEMADKVILTSDNPRSEGPMAILGDIAAGIEDKGKYLIEPDRRSAIKLAFSMAQKDDVVLIAGKGHENYQIVKDKKEAFDDRQVAREVLSELAKKA